jgi:hypothetical protein
MAWLVASEGREMAWGESRMDDVNYGTHTTLFSRSSLSEKWRRGGLKHCFTKLDAGGGKRGGL